MYQTEQTTKRVSTKTKDNALNMTIDPDGLEEFLLEPQLQSYSLLAKF